ncbi:MAG: zinc ribbon domain-containing protein [Bryobacterales bacterium]|nr:zinc ribbon domain-containing protein [Bryobacterales bacterium]
MEPSQRPTHCTCGTLLADGARFCHRCGRPVFEDPHFAEADSTSAADEGSVPSLPSDFAPPPPSVSLEEPVYVGPPEPIDLRNRMVVRLAFFTAAMLFPLVLLPLPMALKSVLLVSGGFFAAWLYQRRTHSRLGYLNAFRLGWIAGLMLFLLVLGVYAVTFAVISFTGGNLLSQLTEAMQSSGAAALPEDQLKLVNEVFSDWTKLFVVMLVALFLLFLYFTALAGIGGAIAARFSRADGRAP